VDPESEKGMLIKDLDGQVGCGCGECQRAYVAGRMLAGDGDVYFKM